MRLRGPGSLTVLGLCWAEVKRLGEGGGWQGCGQGVYTSYSSVRATFAAYPSLYPSGLACKQAAQLLLRLLLLCRKHHLLLPVFLCFFCLSFIRREIFILVSDRRGEIGLG